MKRNEEVKKNVDDMLFKILQYVKAANVSEEEYEVICLELASSLIVSSVTIDIDLFANDEKEKQKVANEINDKLEFLSYSIFNILKDMDLSKEKHIDFD